MLKTKALSPEVKELFETVSRQADKYKSAYAEIERHLQWATSERQNLKRISDQIPQQLEETISKLSKMVEDYISEVSDKSSRAIKIGDELEVIDRYKTDMQKIRAQLQNKMVDLNRAVTEFNLRSEEELAKVLKNLQEKITNELAKETEKVEVRLAVKSKKMETQINAFEQRNRRLVERIRLDSKQIVEEATNNAKEIRIIASDIQDFKELVTPRIKEQHEVILKLRKKYDTDLEKLNDKIDKVMAMGMAGTFGGGGAVGGGTQAPEAGINEDALADPDGIFAPYDPNKKISGDKPLSLDAAPKRRTQEEIIEELSNSIEEEKKKTNMALILAGLSIIGSISLLLLNVLWA